MGPFAAAFDAPALAPDSSEFVLPSGRLVNPIQAAWRRFWTRGAISDDELLIFLGRQELVVGRDRVGQFLAVEVSLGLVDIGSDDRGADILQIETPGQERGRIDADANARLLPARNADQADPRHLGDFLRQTRVRQIFNPWQWKRV